MPQDLEALIDETEHNLLRVQCPKIYGAVVWMVGRGSTTTLISLFFSRIPRMYPALSRRIEATADHVRRKTAGRCGRAESTGGVET